MDPEIFEVIIVGAGVMGSSAAYFLSKTLGNKVLLLEQFDSLHKRGSSHGESRIIRFAYQEEFNVSLMFDAYKFWNEIEIAANTKLLTKTGGLSITHKDMSCFKSVIANMEKYNIKYSVLTPEGTAEKFPSVKLPEDHVGVYNADAGVLNATKCVSTLQNLAKSNGAAFLDNMPVSKIYTVTGTDGAEIINIETKNNKKFQCKKCIITAGAWTRNLVQQIPNFGITLPLSTIQTAIVYWKVDCPDLYSFDKFPIFTYHTSDNVVYGTPALEYPSMIKCAGDIGSPCDPDKRDFKPDIRVIDDARDFLRKFFVGVDESPTQAESCMYTLSPDRQFIIDFLPGSKNVIIGCGFSGHGFKLGPVVGKILSDLATTGYHPYPKVHPHFSLKRFSNIKD